MKRLGLIAILLAGASCGPAANILPINDLDRPTDLAFMCFGAFPAGTGTDGGVPDGGATTLQVSGRPMRACHPQDIFDPGPTTTTRTFAFMPESASGGLTAVDADHWKLADLNPDTGGYGQVPLGQLPSQISVSDDGCRLLSANRGSCDLSLVDPSAVVTPMLSNENPGLIPGVSPQTAVTTIRPIKGDGTPLVSAPYEVAFLPQDTSTLVTGTPSTSDPTSKAIAGPLCSADGAHVPPLGWTGQSTPTPWYALVTYPSCSLIAMIALPSGNIVSAAFVQRDGDSVTLVPAGTSPVCPASSCAGQNLGPIAPAVDAGAADTGVRDSSVALPDAAPDAIHAPLPDGAVDAALDAASPTTGAGGAAGSSGGAAGAGGSGGSSTTLPGGTLGNQLPDVPYFGSAALQPSSIAITPDGTRAYISLSNASFVVSVGLSSSGLALPGNAIYLHEGARGSSRVRLNVDPWRYGSNPGQAGIWVGAQASMANEDPTRGNLIQPSDREYLYAIANDGTVRVIWVFTPGDEVECETNFDLTQPFPTNLPPPFPPSVTTGSACIPVNPSYRRPFSVGPGIHLPSLPVDITSADISQGPSSTAAVTNEQSVNGAHAWVSTDSGLVYLVNINPVLRMYEASIPGDFSPSTPNVTEPVPLANTVRDRNEITYSLTLDSTSGPPRVDVLPNTPVTGPYIEPIYTQGTVNNATATDSSYIQTAVFFPQVYAPQPPPTDSIDRRAVAPQTWAITWEGALGPARNTGIPMSLSKGLSGFPAAPGAPVTVNDSVFDDGGVNFCGSGVVPGDLLTLSGCTQDSQCGIGEVCAPSISVTAAAGGLTVTSICVDPNREDAQTTACQQYMETLRRYQVVAATPNSLVIRPNMDEMARSAMTPCTGPHIAAGITDTCPDPADDPTTDKFTCESSYPGVAPSSPPRCLMRCAADSDCRVGRVCVNFDQPPGTDPKTGAPTAALGCEKGLTDTSQNCFCADAPPFDDVGHACFDQLTNYQLSVGNSFLVAGSQTGIVTTAKLPPGNALCAADPTPDRRFSFRIPMDAPTCTNVDPATLATIRNADPRFDPDSFSGGDQTIVIDNSNALLKLLTTVPSPSDPCLYIGGPAAGDPLTSGPVNPDAGAADAGADGGTAAQPTHVRALFRNAQISFALANLDHGPVLPFSQSFDVHGGFVAQVIQDPVTIEVSMPGRIMLGPVDSLTQTTPGAVDTAEAPYLFVVDQRRLGLEQGGGPTRGQLLRINPFGYTSTVGSFTGYQPIFEDYTASGGLFPIQ
ncbi:MAG TPA: hypothetical protein VHG72_11615 [Polyangia bacterium]|nr:hypothetical protein [Polyangia bacterium]